MKLPLLTCDGCGEAFDDADPRWERDAGLDLHDCENVGRYGARTQPKGRAVLKRSRSRQDAIDDEAAAIAASAPAIETEARRAVRRRELGLP